jgi:hypothetical protein
MGDTVGGGQAFELEHWPPVSVASKPYTLGPKGVGHSYDVNDIPTRIAVFPFPDVRVEEITVKQVADKLIVEPQIVIADDTRSRLRELLEDCLREFTLGQPVGSEARKPDAGDHQRLGRWQDLIAQLAVNALGRVDDIEVSVGSNTCKLKDSIMSWPNACRLKIVPI